jgi:hypothetical protein
MRKLLNLNSICINLKSAAVFLTMAAASLQGRADTVSRETPQFKAFTDFAMLSFWERNLSGARADEVTEFLRKNARSLDFHIPFVRPPTDPKYWMSRRWAADLTKQVDQWKSIFVSISQKKSFSDKIDSNLQGISLGLSKFSNSAGCKEQFFAALIEDFLQKYPGSPEEAHYFQYHLFRHFLSLNETFIDPSLVRKKYAACQSSLNAIDMLPVDSSSLKAIGQIVDKEKRKTALSDLFSSSANDFDLYIPSLYRNLNQIVHLEKVSSAALELLFDTLESDGHITELSCKNSEKIFTWLKILQLTPSGSSLLSDNSLLKRAASLLIALNSSNIIERGRPCEEAAKGMNQLFGYVYSLPPIPSAENKYGPFIASQDGRSLVLKIEKSRKLIACALSYWSDENGIEFLDQKNLTQLGATVPGFTFRSHTHIQKHKYGIGDFPVYQKIDRNGKTRLKMPLPDVTVIEE